MKTLRALFWLTRPKGSWIIATAPLIGLGFGLWERGSTVSPLRVAPTVGLLFASWWVGNAGALWLNAVLDRDEGGLLFGRAVPVPRATAPASYLALALSVAIALPLGPGPAACAAGCAILSVLYSHPKTAWKGHPIGGPLVNVLGYGLLSPMAGWFASEPIFTWRTGVTLAFANAFILGVFFAAQAFQAEEDAARGYRTLVVTHGPRRTLITARALIGAASVGAIALAALGAYPRTLLVVVPLLWSIDRHLTRWAARPDGGDASYGAAFVLRIALATLLAVAAVYADHFWALAHDLPPGGLGTALEVTG